MTRTRTKWLLWLAGLLLMPLPYLFLYEGAVPVVRYIFLTAVAGSYALFIDGSEMAWPMAFIMLAHALVFALALLTIAAALARLIPGTLRKTIVVTTFVVGLAVAVALPIYTTPMDDDSIHTNWIGLFQ
jgi:hypothetical protein